MATYRIFKAPGWHREPADPMTHETDDEREAAMMAGERVDIHMPGNCSSHDCYAEDEDGETVTPIESFRCDVCDELFEWGECGPQGGYGGSLLECPEGMEKHLVTWMCDACADEYEIDYPV